MWFNQYLIRLQMGNYVFYFVPLRALVEYVFQNHLMVARLGDMQNLLSYPTQIQVNFVNYIAFKFLLHNYDYCFNWTVRTKLIMDNFKFEVFYYTLSIPSFFCYLSMLCINDTSLLPCLQVLMGLSLEMAAYCLLIILNRGVCLKWHSLRMMVILGARFSHWRIHWEWNSLILQLSRIVMG